MTVAAKAIRKTLRIFTKRPRAIFAAEALIDNLPAVRGPHVMPSRGGRVTTVFRTARCGPACRVVWQGCREILRAPYLDQRQGSGTFVRCGLPGNSTVFLKPPHVDGPQRAVALVEARTLIEMANARVACEHASADDQDELSRLCADMNTALHLDEHESFFKHDADFHHALAKSTGNPCSRV